MCDKCDHDMIYGKNNIRVPLPPIYVREVWNCWKTNVEYIRKAISESDFDWNKVFENLTIDEKVALLSQTLLNLFRKYISNKSDYRQPPWMN